MLKGYYEKNLRTYHAQFTEKNNDNIYLQDWYNVYITAENGKQAIEFLKRDMNKKGYNTENYIYTIMGIETVYLFWAHESVKVYMEQKPIFDEETGYNIYISEDGRWIAKDDAIGYWVQIR